MAMMETDTPATQAAGAVGVAAFSPVALRSVVERIREPAVVVRDEANGRIGVAVGGGVRPEGRLEGGGDGLTVLGSLPPMYPEWLGERSFSEVHRVRFPYIVGEMAQGVATAPMVVAAARAGLTGFFGAAGLPLERVDSAIREIRAALGTQPGWGVNLIHNPDASDDEQRVAELCVQHGVPAVSASAFMALTPAVIYCACAGLGQDAAGRIVRPRRIVAKVSRPEVAELFLSPPPPRRSARWSPAVCSARLRRRWRRASRWPRTSRSRPTAAGTPTTGPLVALLPTMLALRDGWRRSYGYPRPMRVGAAGGLATPSAVAAAFALGAAYVLTGSVNQACVESGLSDAGQGDARRRPGSPT